MTRRVPDASEQRENWEWVLDSSRRARGFTLYAAIRSLGREGIRALVEQLLRPGGADGGSAARDRGVEVLNDVVLNQVLVRFGDDEPQDARGHRGASRPTARLDGRNDLEGQAAMRISVSNWSTTEADADRTVDAILRCATSS